MFVSCTTCANSCLAPWHTLVHIVVMIVLIVDVIPGHVHYCMREIIARMLPCSLSCHWHSSSAPNVLSTECWGGMLGCWVGMLGMLGRDVGDDGTCA